MYMLIKINSLEELDKYNSETILFVVEMKYNKSLTVSTIKNISDILKGNEKLKFNKNGDYSFDNYILSTDTFNNNECLVELHYVISLHSTSFSKTLYRGEEGLTLNGNMPFIYQFKISKLIEEYNTKHRVISEEDVKLALQQTPQIEKSKTNLTFPHNLEFKDMLLENDTILLKRLEPDEIVEIIKQELSKELGSIGYNKIINMVMELGGIKIEQFTQLNYSARIGVIEVSNG